MADASLVQKILDLDTSIDETESRLKELKRERSDVEQNLLKQFLDEEVFSQKVSHKGKMKTVYLHTTIGVAPKDGNRLAVVRALRDCGLEDMVDTEPNFNTRTLGAWVNNQGKADLPIPPQLEAVINIARLSFVRVRNS